MNRLSNPKKRKPRIINVPVRPWNATYFMSYDENELRFKTNPWEIRRVWVAGIFLLISILLGFAGYERLPSLWYNPKMMGCVIFLAGVLVATYLGGAAFYILFNRTGAVLNREGLKYQYRLFVYRLDRHIPLNEILCFEFDAKRIDSRHTDYCVKAILPDNSELNFFCAKSDDAAWLTIELNYMRNYLLARESKASIPPFRQDGILNEIEYRFEQKHV